MVTHFPAGIHRSEPARSAFSAIADPVRRAILDGLRAGPRPAGEIAGDFAISRPAVSKHLRVLSESGLVRVEKSGRERRYALDPAPLGQVEAWLDRHRTAWAARMVALKRQVETGAAEPPRHDPDKEPRP